MDLRGHKDRFTSKVPLFFSISICFFFVFVLFSTISSRTPCLDVRSSSGSKIDFHMKEIHKAEEKLDKISLSLRRYLSGPGSFPPQCKSKCGRCNPCKPVHVTVPRGTSVTTEYYPEAWRCKCGNKLYMP